MLNSDQAGDRAAVSDHTEELVQEAFELLPVVGKPLRRERGPPKQRTR